MFHSNESNLFHTIPMLSRSENSFLKIKKKFKRFISESIIPSQEVLSHLHVYILITEYTCIYNYTCVCDAQKCEHVNVEIYT